MYWAGECKFLLNVPRLSRILILVPRKPKSELPHSNSGVKKMCIPTATLAATIWDEYARKESLPKQVAPRLVSTLPDRIWKVSPEPF